MSPTARFVLILSVMVVSTAAGAWTVRRWPKSRQAIAPLLNFMIVGLIPFLSVLSVWRLPLSWMLVWMPIVFLVYTVFWWGLGRTLVRFHRLRPKDAGSFLLAAGMSNCGFTMGGFVCYALLQPPEQALGLSLLFMLPWIPVTYGYFFPWAGSLARQSQPSPSSHGTHTPSSGFSWWEWAGALLDWRSLGLLATVAGLILNWLTGAVPAWGLDQAYLVLEPAILPLMVLINMISFFSIGHAFRLRAIRLYTRLYVSLGVLRFVYAPLVAILVIGMLRAGGVRLGTTAEAVLLIQGTMPTAVFGTVISQTCGLNPRLASLLFVVNTVTFLVLILPVLVWAFGN